MHQGRAGEKITPHTLTDGREKELRAFCARLGLHFKDLSLLDLAFHHRSVSNESAEFAHRNNERLEFLGDSVLGLVAASCLYRNFERDPEGDLAKIKSVVVSEKTLARVALEMGLDRLLVLGRGEEKSGGRKKPAILADCVEAVIGAYFLDSGWEAAEAYVLSFLVPEIAEARGDRAEPDYKSLLQELYQRDAKEAPRYETVGVDGPEHDRTFSVVVRLGERTFGPGRGKNKKAAARKAAEIAYTALTENALRTSKN